MSHQVRFKIKDLWYKVRLFIQSSNRLPCVCCGIKKDGVKFRHIEPKKVPDGLICYECLVKLSHGQLVAVDPPVKREIVIGQDGDQVTATFEDFVNLQKSICGFGETEDKAIADLLTQQQKIDIPIIAELEDENEALKDRVCELEAEIDLAKTGNPPSPFELLNADSIEADCEKCRDDIAVALKAAGLKDTDFVTWKDAFLAIPPKEANPTDPVTPETK